MECQREKRVAGQSKAWPSKPFYRRRGKKIVANAETSPIQRIKVFTAEQNSIFGKESSSRTIKRILKKRDMTWKRMGKSLKQKRDETLSNRNIVENDEALLVKTKTLFIYGGTQKSYHLYPPKIW